MRARAEVVPMPPGIATLPNNKGLEALAFAPRRSKLAGTLIAFSERGLDADGNLKAFLIGGPTPGEFSVKRRDDFDISDCTMLPVGDVLLLERRFSLLRGGIAMRLRRIALADIAPGALVDGPVLMFADMGYQIDNMEGLSVHRTAGGRPRPDADFGRQFLVPAAHRAAAVQADRGMRRRLARRQLARASWRSGA